jgi:hypothetical protein
MKKNIDIINRYNISEYDLYTLGIIEAKKDTLGFIEKEKLKAKSLGILKPYNVNFMDLGNLLSAIKTQSYHTNETLINKYGEIDLDTKASSMGLKYVIPVLVGALVFFYIIKTYGGNTNAESNTNTEANTNTESNSVNNNNESEETSKNVYRQGYSDGQMGFGLPASDRASAMESYMAHGYNFSSADVYVYEMGYNDGMYGRSKQY